MVLTVEDNVDKIPEYFLTLWQHNHLQWQGIHNVSKLFLHRLTVPAYVTIHLKPCPVGFELLKDDKCGCSSSLTEYVTSCSIDKLSITKKSHIWLTNIALSIIVCQGT